MSVNNFLFTSGKAKGKRKHKKTSKKEKVVTDSVTVAWKWITKKDKFWDCSAKKNEKLEQIMRLYIGTETQTEAKKKQIIIPASKTDARKKADISILL